MTIDFIITAKKKIYIYIILIVKLLFNICKTAYVK